MTRLSYGTSKISQHWQVGKYIDMADITPVHDLREHWLGDECWCNPDQYRPCCGNCGQMHFCIFIHKPENKAIPYTAAIKACNSLMRAAMVREY